MRKRFAVLALLAASSFVPALARPAHAQDAASAEVLFQKGHQLFEAKKYAEACPKFAESYRLDPVSGALLALAACHEAEGKLASAWSEYVDVVARARREGKNDRADAAQKQANLLEPKLAHVTIGLAPGADAIAGLVVKRDGVVVGGPAFGTPLPVDRGEHVIEAAAPGRQPFTKKVVVQDGATDNVAVPVLAAAPDAAPPVTPPDATKTGPAQAQPAEPHSSFPTRTFGIVVGGVGLATMAVGGVFGGIAISKNSQSNQNGCDATTNVCTGTGRTMRSDAVSAGNTSTILFVVGGVLTAGGIALFIVGGSSSSDATKTAIAAAPAVGPGSAGMALTGRF